MSIMVDGIKAARSFIENCPHNVTSEFYLEWVQGAGDYIEALRDALRREQFWLRF